MSKKEKITASSKCCSKRRGVNRKKNVNKEKQKEEKVDVWASSCVSVCISPRKADTLYLPGNRRPVQQKPLFTGEAPVSLLTRLFPASLAFLRWNLKWRFHAHTRMWSKPVKKRLYLTNLLSCLLNSIPAGICWLQLRAGRHSQWCKAGNLSF